MSAIPLSVAVRFGTLVSVSGQVGLDGGQMVGEDVATQTTQTLANISAILADFDLDLASVVKTTVFLTNMADFVAFNEAYAAAFAEPFPARSTVEVAGLPRADALVEIEVLASTEPRW